jgi:hypothetical protein
MALSYFINKITFNGIVVMFEKELEFNCIVPMTKNIIANFIKVLSILSNFLFIPLLVIWV